MMIFWVITIFKAETYLEKLYRIVTQAQETIKKISLVRNSILYARGSCAVLTSIIITQVHHPYTLSAYCT